MINLKIIRGEDNRYEYIKNSYNIKFKCLVDDDEDNEDISDWLYNPELIEHVPLFEIQYTYVKYPDEKDLDQRVPEEINDALDVYLGDTLIFANERIVIEEPEFDTMCPRMADFYKYIRKLAAAIENNFNNLTAIELLS